MLKILFEQQRKYLNNFFDSVDLKDTQKVVDWLVGCKGTIILTGVGKSGHIAEKISATLLSTGNRSFFLSPSNALHGDMGFISKEDIFIVFSKSGESQELIQLIPHIKKKGAKIIAVVSKEGSRVEKMADLTVFLPIERELCPHDLVPTTSTSAQLIFGDCLAVALMKLKNMSIGDFAENHPGGLLGRKITLKVNELMLKGDEIPLCNPSDKLIDLLHNLSVKRCGCLIVANDKKHILGIFTDGDLRRAIQNKGPDALQRPIEELMTKKVKTISSQQLAIEAARLMEEDPSKLITVLPVTDGGRIVGLLRMHDILQKELS